MRCREHLFIRDCFIDDTLAIVFEMHRQAFVS